MKALIWLIVIVVLIGGGWYGYSLLKPSQPVDDMSKTETAVKTNVPAIENKTVAGRVDLSREKFCLSDLAQKLSSIVGADLSLHNNPFTEAQKNALAKENKQACVYTTGETKIDDSPIGVEVVYFYAPGATIAGGGEKVDVGLLGNYQYHDYYSLWSVSFVDSADKYVVTINIQKSAKYQMTKEKTIAIAKLINDELQKIKP